MAVLDRIGTNGWRTIFGVIAAVCSFLLIQTDQPIEGWAKVIIGAVSVAVAVIQPPKGDAG